MSKTLEAQAAEARDQAQVAQQKAQELRDQAEAEQRATEKQNRRAAYEFALARQETFPMEFAKPIRKLRDAFTEAVVNDGDTLDAWRTYMLAIHAAAKEDAVNDEAVWRYRQDRFDSIAKQLNEWRGELEHYRNVNGPTYTAPSFGSGGVADMQSVPGKFGPVSDKTRAPRGWWSETIDDIMAASEQPKQREPGSRVEQINQDISSLAAALGVDFTREPLDLGWFDNLSLIEKPRGPRIGVGEIERWERRHYTQALNETLAEHLAARGIEEWKEARGDALARFKAQSK